MHYALDEWVDFTRGLVAPETHASMARHLATGCIRCRENADFCAKVGQACRRLSAEPVPESVIRRAKAIFPVRRSAWPHRGSRLPVELVFDSFLAPSPAGLRANWQVGWQGLYRAGDCSVDLRIEPELKSTRAAVIGQIISQLPEVEMSNISVSLRSGNQVVAETLSNRFGEFQMEYEQQARLKLCIVLADGSEYIQVPLKRLTKEVSVGGAVASRRRRSSHNQP